MDSWTVTHIAVDFFLAGAALYCFLALRKEMAGRAESGKRLAELRELDASLRQLLKDAGETSNKIGREIERKRSLATEIFATLEKEKASLIQLIRELNAEKEKIAAPVPDDKYSEAFKLAQTGLSAEEIARRTKIPLGEIELALSLRK
ncbi:MAG: DUF2802 domain-containing protein [Nitrospinae bacterium]|nr:DUF2802 domain-containing protein [Nitrospinota bacterium]